MSKFLWTEKYRPSKLSEFIFHNDSQKAQITKMVKEKEIPHLLFSGVQGSGKTTLSRIILNELEIDDMDVLTINASDENSVETIRNRVLGFAGGFPMGDFLVIQLEEMDYLSLSAQAVLRSTMEDLSDTCRFIGTCNYPQKVMPALVSRMQHFHFKTPNLEEVSVYAAEILMSEGVEFEIDVLEKYVSAAYPDVRKIINMLQQSITEDKKLPPPDTIDVGDYKFKILDQLEQDDWQSLRKLVCENVGRDEFEDLYRFLYTNLHKSKKFSDNDKYEAGIVLIASYLYKHGICADPEINAAALFIELGQV